jgi:exosortase B
MQGGGIPVSPQVSGSGIRTFVENDMVSMSVLLIGWAVLYVPTFWDLARTIWAHDEQGHGPIILAVSLWLLFQKREEIRAMQAVPWPIVGFLSLFLGLLFYVFGRSQSIIMFEVGSQIFVLASLFLIFKGFPTLKLAWFPLFFLIFMVPLPGGLVAVVTAPLKAAVSTVAESVLYQLGFPVARTGVMLSVGQYQLLVADACAGLNSMFTLEALGLLYLNLMRYTSATRNIILAVLIVPIAFFANVTRVMILVLVTYFLGGEAGQGFIHGFAGIVLFAVALTFILLADAILGLRLKSALPRS